MVSVPVFSSDTGEKIETVEFPEEKLGGEVRRGLIREAILMYETNRHIGTSSTKTRTEVAGSNAKPWRQKGTGRARAGHKRSNIWRHGGISHGPQPRNRKYQLATGQKKQAMQSALLAKCLGGEVLLVDRLELPEIKTKQMIRLLDLLKVQDTALIGMSPYDAKILKSARNIPGVAVRDVRLLNAYDLLVPKQLLFAKQAFLELIDGASGKEGGAAPESGGS